MSRKVVVLHGVDDIAVVKSCCQSLEEAGVTCWSPYLDLAWSRDPHADTRNAIEASQGLVLIVGENGEVSDDAFQILAFSQGKDKFCFLGSSHGVPKGELENTLWDAVCDIESGQVETIVRALPYQPPAIATAQPVAPAAPIYVAYPRGLLKMTGGLAGFESLRSRSTWTLGFIGLAMLTLFLSLLGQLQALSGVFDRSTMTPSEAVRFGEQTAGAVLMEVGALFLIVGSLIPFLIWVHGAMKNLQALGIKSVSISSDFAVACFLVPILNMFMAVTVLSRLARASMPWSRDDDPTSWERNKTPNFVVLWIVSWYSAFFLADVVSRLQPASPNDVHWLMYGATLRAISGMILLISGASLCITVSKVTRWQEDHFQGMSTLAARFTSKPVDTLAGPVWAAEAVG